VSSFIFYLLSKKIETYEEYNHLFPSLGGIFSNDGIEGYPRVIIRDVGVFVWPLIAVYQVLSEYVGEKNDLAQDLTKRFKAHIDLIAECHLPLFYDVSNDEGGLWIDAYVLNKSAEFSQQNREPYSEEHLHSTFTQQLVLYFAHFYANWTDEFGGEAGKAKMWSRILTQEIAYEIDSEKLRFERGGYFESRERYQYLMLPFLDVPIDEKVFRNGEIARTHYSNSRGIPGLLSSTYNYSTAVNHTQWLNIGIKVSFNEYMFNRSGAI
jgi:hypothetical protein